MCMHCMNQNKGGKSKQNLKFSKLKLVRPTCVWAGTTYFILFPFLFVLATYFRTGFLHGKHLHEKSYGFGHNNKKVKVMRMTCVVQSLERHAGKDKAPCWGNPYVVIWMCVCVVLLYNILQMSTLALCEHLYLWGHFARSIQCLTSECSLTASFRGMV